MTAQRQQYIDTQVMLRAMLCPQESGDDEGYFRNFFQFLLMASKREIPKVL
jgi:hypothetical protein